MRMKDESCIVFDGVSQGRDWTHTVADTVQ